MAPAATAMTASIDEDTVDFKPNYDSRELEPAVLPVGDPQPRRQRRLRHRGRHGHQHGPAQPRRGGAGAAAPDHATRRRPRRPDAVRARARPADRRQDRRARRDPRRLRDRPRARSGCAPPRASRASPRAARASSSPSCPTASGPSGSSSGSSRLVQGKKLQGISDVKDLTDREKGLRLVIEVKNGFDPEAILEQLYRLTPMEDSFGINAVALVDGQPRTLGLKEMLEVFLGHRYDVVRRRSAFRRGKACRPAAPRRGAAPRDPRHRRGDPADPRQRQRREGPGAADVGVRPDRGAGDVHPRHAAAPADEVLPARARQGAGRARGDHRRARRDPRGRRAAAEGRLRRARRRRQDLRHPAPHGPAGVGRARPSAPRSRSRWPTTRASSTCPAAACSRAPPTSSHRATGRAAAPSTTSSSRRSAPPLAARSVCSPASAGS